MKVRIAKYTCKNGVTVTVSKNMVLHDEWYVVTAIDAEGEELYLCNHDWKGAMTAAGGLIEAFNE